MNGTNAFRHLRKIEQTKGKNDKIALVGEPGGDAFWKKVLTYAYDPFITYGLTPPKVESDGRLIIEGDTERRVFATLDLLRERKLTGNAAKEQVKELLLSLDPENSELLWRILKKDLRAGFTENTILKNYSGLFEVFEVMLAHHFEEKRITAWPVAAEPKLDGFRACAIVAAGTAMLATRTGREHEGVEHLYPAIATMVDQALAAAPDGPLQKMLTLGRADGKAALFIDGELVTGEFQKTSGDLRRKDGKAADAVFHVFDAVPLAAFNAKGKEVKIPYKARRQLLEHVVKAAPPDAPIRLGQRYFCSSLEELYKLYEHIRSTDFYGKPGEGLVVKPLDGTYSKKRSHAWLKLKAEETVDITVKDAFEGEGKYAGMLGGLIGDLDGVEVRVGGGFSDAERRELWATYKADMVPFEDAGTTKQELLGRIIEVEYHEKTPDGSLRHPRFKRFRDTAENPGAKI